MSQTAETNIAPVDAPDATHGDGADASAAANGETVVDSQGNIVAVSRSARHTPEPPKGLLARLWQPIERKLSELSTQSNFWHRVLAFVFLPLAYRSGIRFKHVASDSASIVLPFRRFNKNWYRAMAGAALLGNSEVAGGMYVFGKVGAKYTVVCKEMRYRFLRPCFGPAIYHIKPVEDLDAMIANGEEFNVTLRMKVVQAVVKKNERERRVGQCEITFHVTPKTQHRARDQRRAERKG